MTKPGLMVLPGWSWGKRLDGWDDTMIDHFGFEIRGMAHKLARRLALIREGKARAAPVTAIHLTTSDGKERSLFLRNGADNEGAVKAGIRKNVGPGRATRCRSCRSAR